MLLYLANEPGSSISLSLAIKQAVLKCNNVFVNKLVNIATMKSPLESNNDTSTIPEYWSCSYKAPSMFTFYQSKGGGFQEHPWLILKGWACIIMGHNPHNNTFTSLCVCCGKSLPSSWTMLFMFFHGALAIHKKDPTASELKNLNS